MSNRRGDRGCREDRRGAGPATGATAPGERPALDLLRALLLADSVVDDLPPEVRHYLSDQVSREFGSGAERRLHEVVRSRLRSGGDLAALARDRAFLVELLAALRA